MAILSAKIVGSNGLVTDDDTGFSVELIAWAGSAAICARTVSNGSIASPRMAVTSPVVEDVAEVNADGVLVPDAGVEKVERRRKIADGFSLDNIPRTCEPFPGQKKCTVQP